jgi:hypothetical protein
MPVILATWEAEIRRIVVPVQPRQKVCKTSSQLIGGYSGAGLSPQATREAEFGRTVVLGQLGGSGVGRESETLISKEKKTGHGGTCLSSQGQWGV